MALRVVAIGRCTAGTRAWSIAVSSPTHIAAAAMAAGLVAGSCTLDDTGTRPDVPLDPSPSASSGAEGGNGAGGTAGAAASAGGAGPEGDGGGPSGGSGGANGT